MTSLDSQVDAAMDAALADSAAPAAPAASTSHTVGSDAGPISSDQAEKLISKAVKSAVNFSDAMHELFTRRAWEALGYVSPREMIRERFYGTLINPQTGQPYADSHVNRMSHVAWMLWAVSEATGVDPADLRIPERMLRQVPAGRGGENYEELADLVVEQVKETGAADAETVQGIVDRTLEASAQERTPTRPEPVERPHAADTEFQGAADDPADGPGVVHTPGVDDIGDDDGQPAAPRPRAETATGTFDGEMDATGQLAPEGMSMSEALDQMRHTETTVTAVKELSGFAAQLRAAADAIVQAAPAMTAAVSAATDAVEAKRTTEGTVQVEGLFDSLSEDELDQLRDSIGAALKQLPSIDAAAQLLEGLSETAPDMEEAALAAGEAASAAKVLQEMLDEVDFVQDGFDEGF